MEIIIAGAGQVWFNLAKTLSNGHNIILIDKNGEALHIIQKSLDILTIEGDIEDIKTCELPPLIEVVASCFIVPYLTNQKRLAPIEDTPQA